MVLFHLFRIFTRISRYMNAKKRKEELLKVFEGVDEGKDIIYPLIDEVIYLEGQLEELRKLPMIVIDKANPTRQRPTTASKQYKDFLQQYNNCIKTLSSTLRKNAAEEESPLREFLKKANMER